MNDLSHIHKEIARLEFAGHRPSEIVLALGDLNVTLEYVNRIRANPIYQHFLKRMEDKTFMELKDVRKTLVQKAHDMLEIVIDLAEDDKNSSTTRLRAAQDILDRAGYKPVAKEVRLNINEGFNQEERESLRRLHDQMKYGGFILDVDIKEVGPTREKRRQALTNQVPQELLEPTEEELPAECGLQITEPLTLEEEKQNGE